MNCKAILLDVDGVLIDSEKVFNDCWRNAATIVGYSMTFEQALELRSLDSKLAQELFVTWYNDENAYSKILLEKQKNDSFNLKDAVTPTEDLEEIMKSFSFYPDNEEEKNDKK